MTIERKWLMITSCDTNDGDYSQDISVVGDTEKEEIEAMVERVKALEINPESDYRSGPRKSYIFKDDEEYNEISDWCISYFSGGENGFHTLEDITFYEITGKVDKSPIHVRWENIW